MKQDWLFQQDVETCALAAARGFDINQSARLATVIHTFAK
jgi:hypothetical protein